MNKDEFFARYEIDFNNGRLGGGSFGTVYKAYDNLIDQWVAIKIAELKIVEGREFSLISEFNATSNIPIHRNIAHYESVYQFEMKNGRFDYAVMQYYEEGNLKQLNKSTRLSLVEKTEILTGLLSGISYLHNYQVIHRDIKPSNILISMNTRGVFIPKIADFGLAKLQAINADLGMTNSMAGGTLEYSSPEQLFGQKLLMNTDLWSFGVLAFYLFTGEKPFVAEDKDAGTETKRSQIYRKIIDAKIPDTIQQCPFPWNRIIERCLVRDPYERVQSAKELLDILQKPHLGHGADISAEEGTIVMSSTSSVPKEIDVQQASQENKQSVHRLRVKSIREKAEKHTKQIIRLEEKLSEQEFLLKHLKAIKAEKEEQQKSLNMGPSNEDSTSSKRNTDEKTKKLLEEQAIILKELARHKQAKAEAEEALLGGSKSNDSNKTIENEVEDSIQEKKVIEPNHSLTISSRKKIEETKKGSIVIKSIKKKDEGVSFAVPIPNTNKGLTAQVKKETYPVKKNLKKWISMIAGVLLVVLGVVFFPDLSNESSDGLEGDSDVLLEQVLSQESIEELVDFINSSPDHPEISRAHDALNKLKLVEEDEFWNIAIRRKNVTGYEVYINNYKDGQYIDEARDSLKLILEDMKTIPASNAWSLLGHDPSINSLYHFIDVFEGSEYAERARKLIEE